MRLALFFAAWFLLGVAFCVWHHRAIGRHRRAPLARARSRLDVGRLADRHPWLVWLTAAVITAAWLAHNASAQDSESPTRHSEGTA
ncbi:hypothetical protein OKW38_002261 [Paraburkholderia sp. MM5496-R1]|uniref:hypothetical protein n=1 Tax=Paraburkholderia sp. MM5496-R1 TaxID=2991065 RepID=UPI003D1F20DA